MEKLTYSIPEVAQVLGVSKPTAYVLANTKGFPVLKIGKRKVIPVEGLQEWVKTNSKVSQSEGRCEYGTYADIGRGYSRTKKV